jgi:tRNA (uracil-5-)-methyltransferase TRM9
MIDSTVEAILLEINRNFYQAHASSFSSTRRRLQPGVNRLCGELPPGGSWLDLGCGNGTLALRWAEDSVGIAGSRFVGLDFSPGLLEDARRGARHWLEDNPSSGQEIIFLQADLSSGAWSESLPAAAFDVVCAFAALHHLPGSENRLHLVELVHSLLKPGGRFVHSEWQFQHSERLMARRLGWETVGLDSSRLEEGDTLLDWRHQVDADSAGSALRYVHLFSREELAWLASAGGFRIEQEFESDGKEGNLALYQVWRAL